MSERGGASLTIHTTPWERQRVELMKTYGTTDIDEAIRRENKIEEMKHMEGKCEACGGKFDYDGRRHKKPPEKCSDCGGPEGCIPMMFDPPPEEPIDVPVRRRKGCCIPGCPEPRSERKDSHRCIKHQREYDRERTSASRARKTKPEMPPPGTPMPDPTEDTRPVPEDYRPPIRTFSTGATRDTDEGKPDYEGFLSPLVIEAYGEYMTRHRVQPDGNLRSSDNWQKGIPKSEYMKSGWRHFFDWWKEHRGYDSREGLINALCALMFNVMGYLHEVLKESDAE